MILHFPHSHAIENDTDASQALEKLIEHPIATKVIFPLHRYLHETSSPKVIRETIKTDYDRTHHTALLEAVAKELDAIGTALIMEFHTFSAGASSNGDRPKRITPDICIGSDTFHTPLALLFSAVRHFKNLGYNVKVNDPFDAIIVPKRFFHKNSDLCAMSVYLNDRLYVKDRKALQDDLNAWLNGYLDRA